MKMMRYLRRVIWDQCKRLGCEEVQAAAARQLTASLYPLTTFLDPLIMDN